MQVSFNFRNNQKSGRVKLNLQQQQILRLFTLHALWPCIVMIQNKCFPFSSYSADALFECFQCSIAFMPLWILIGIQLSSTKNSIIGCCLWITLLCYSCLTNTNIQTLTQSRFENSHTCFYLPYLFFFSSINLRGECLLEENIDGLTVFTCPIKCYFFFLDWN